MYGVLVERGCPLLSFVPPSSVNSSEGRKEGVGVSEAEKFQCDDFLFSV